MDTNWYVIQVRSGHEDKIVNACHTYIPEEILKKAFVPKYKHVRKIRGEWKQLESPLFTGYVFLITDHIEELFYSLHKIPDFTKLLGNDGDDIYPLTRKDAYFIERFVNDEYILDMSIGHIIGDKVIINEGPLLGYEGLITKIDRHKRIAYLDINLFDQHLIAKVGLEIISKSKE